MPAPLGDVLIVSSWSLHTYMQPRLHASWICQLACPWFVGALERMGAILLEGTEGVTIDNCRFTRLDSNAVFLSGCVLVFVCVRTQQHGRLVFLPCAGRGAVLAG